MMYRMPIHPTDLTPELLTDIIDEMHPGVKLGGAKIVQVKDYGEINVSTSARVTLDLDYREPAARPLPQRVVVKMSLADDVWCGKLHSFFENEVNFYRRIRPELAIESPLALGGRYDPQSHRYLLILEDVGAKHAHFSSMMDETTAKDIESVLDTHARLHAHFWASPRFGTDLAWVQSHIHGAVEELMHTLVRAGIREELEKQKVKRELLGRLGWSEERLYQGVCALKRHQSRLPRTLLHGDSHFGNTYRLPDGTGGLYDWQLFVRGYAMHDVTYIITTGLSVEMRRKHERALLEFYRDRLGSYGVREVPDLETLWLEHRRATLWCFYLGWVTCPTANYGWELLMLALLRTSAAYEDHDTGKAIEAIL